MSTPPTHPSIDLPRIVLADRGDALVGPLSDAMRAHFHVVDQLHAELSRPERLLVAATTFRPARRAWAERFFKSNLAVALRSRRARSALAATTGRADVVFQTHALFVTSDPRTVIYVDCTHRQSMQEWPDWNPLRGRALDRWLARETAQYQQAAHLFAFYEGTARSLVEDYGVPQDRVTVVGAGVNLDVGPPSEASVDAPPTVLFVGNDFERKGGLRLLEAFAELRRRVPDARLRIVGTPYPVPGTPGVEHLGRIHDRDRMSEIYREADVFCLPSYFDPFPGVLLEAMAHALPCVATAVCGIPEIVLDGETGLLVGRRERTSTDPGAVVDLADALERLLSDPEEARRLGRAGRRRVDEQFRWDHVLDRMAPALHDLAVTHGPGEPTTTDPITHPTSRTST